MSPRNRKAFMAAAVAAPAIRVWWGLEHQQVQMRKEMAERERRGEHATDGKKRGETREMRTESAKRGPQVSGRLTVRAPCVGEGETAGGEG
jgi:hypothetical protein